MLHVFFDSFNIEALNLWLQSNSPTVIANFFAEKMLNFINIFDDKVIIVTLVIGILKSVDVTAVASQWWDWIILIFGVTI